MIKPKVVLLIFVSGKIVLTGAKVGTIFLAAITFSITNHSGTYHNPFLARFERRSTRLSIRSTLCSANSANLEDLPMSRSSRWTLHCSHQATSETMPSIPFYDASLVMGCWLV